MKALTEKILSILLISSCHLFGESDPADKTLGMLNKTFKGYAISNGETKVPDVTITNYEFPVQGFEADSRQNIRGVAFAIRKNGEIMAVVPISPHRILPDQHPINVAIDSGETVSKILTENDFEKLDQFQAYGLLSKAAIAILVRAENATVKLELSDSQKVGIESLFESKIKVPTLIPSDGDEANLKKIQVFAKAIIKYYLY